MSKRTTQKLAELKQLAGEAGSNMYRRVKLATEVLSDLSWLTQAYGGDELAAMDALADEYFADVKGFITLGKLRQLYQEFPDESSWRDLRYDLAAMEAQYDINHAQEDSGLKGSRTSWKAEAEKYKEEVTDLKGNVAKATRERDQAVKELQKLRDRVHELEQENAELRGRIMELERLVSPVGAAQ